MGRSTVGQITLTLTVMAVVGIYSLLALTLTVALTGCEPDFDRSGTRSFTEASLEGPTPSASSAVWDATPSFSSPTLTVNPSFVPPTACPTWLPPTATRPPAADVTLYRGPYLQSVTTDSVIVVWETDRPASGEVVYGETAAYGRRVTAPAVRSRHAVTLTGLAPYTNYHYRIESQGRLPDGSTDAWFRTAALPDASSSVSLTFVVFGDTRTQHERHRAVVERIAAYAPDFVLHTGDLVADGTDERQWDLFFAIERDLLAHAPFFPVLGNHERNAVLYFDNFYLPANERWYTFVNGPVRFIALQVDGYASFALGSEQYTWLEQTLQANTYPWLCVYFHIPPYTSVEEELEHQVRRTLTPLFEQYGVDLVFSGHKHSYERNEVQGITYIVTAGGGAPLYPMAEREPGQVVFASAYHFVVVTINGDYLIGEAISVTGELLDRFERWAD